MAFLINHGKAAAAFFLQRREHFWNFLSSIGLKVIAFALYFIAIPPLVATKGAETYGIIAFIIAILGYSSLIDNGLTYTVQLKYVRALTSNAVDPERVVRVAIPIYAFITLLIFFAVAPNGAGLSQLIWNTDAYAQLAPAVATLLALQVAGALPAAVLLGHNRVTLVNVARLAADLLRVTGLLVAAAATDPIGTTIFFCILGSAIKFAIDLYNCNRLVGLRRILPLWSASETATLLKTAWIMWLIAAMSLVTLLYDKWFVSSNISPSDYAAYGISSDLTTKIYFVFYAISTALYTPLMRRYATEVSSKRLYYAYTSILILIAGAYYIPLSIWAEYILHAYVGREMADAGSNVVRILAANAVTYLIFNLMEMNLYARGKSHLVLPSYVAGIIALIGVTPILSAQFGMPGVAAGVLSAQLTMLFVISIVFYLFTRREKMILISGNREASAQAKN